MAARPPRADGDGAGRRRRDALAGTAVTLSASGSGNTFAAITGITNASGVFTATLASTMAQTETITATEGSAQENTSVIFVAASAGPPSPPTLSVTSDPNATRGQTLALSNLA